MGKNSLRQHLIITMAELGLKKKEIDAINFSFDVYDFKGDGKVDAFFTGDLIRACNLNPTLNTIKEIGGTTEKGQKKLTKEEAKSLMKELCEPADDEGFMPFIPFLERMCAAEKKTSVPRDTRVKLTSSYFSSDRGHVDNVTS